jgi:hypothetical protein
MRQYRSSTGASARHAASSRAVGHEAPGAPGERSSERAPGRLLKSLFIRAESWQVVGANPHQLLEPARMNAQKNARTTRLVES